MRNLGEGGLFLCKSFQKLLLCLERSPDNNPIRSADLDITVGVATQ